jgi:hypothetical protein
MSVRKGSPKAVMALAHHLITVVYQMLSRGEVYIELGGDYYDRRNKPKVVARLPHRLSKRWVITPNSDPSDRRFPTSRLLPHRRMRADTTNATKEKGPTLQMRRARNYLQTYDLRGR